jgi:hypothetical protein
MKIWLDDTRDPREWLPYQRWFRTDIRRRTSSTGPGCARPPRSSPGSWPAWWTRSTSTTTSATPALRRRGERPRLDRRADRDHRGLPAAPHPHPFRERGGARRDGPHGQGDPAPPRRAPAPPGAIMIMSAGAYADVRSALSAMGALGDQVTRALRLGRLGYCPLRVPAPRVPRTPRRPVADSAQGTEADRSKGCSRRSHSRIPVGRVTSTVV